VNDREEHAHELGALLTTPTTRSYYVNLIPYNPTAVEDHFETPPDADVFKFQQILQSYGLITRVRRRRRKKKGCGGGDDDDITMMMNSINSDDDDDDGDLTAPLLCYSLLPPTTTTRCVSIMVVTLVVPVVS